MKLCPDTTRVRSLMCAAVVLLGLALHPSPASAKPVQALLIEWRPLPKSVAFHGPRLKRQLNELLAERGWRLLKSAPKSPEGLVVDRLGLEVRRQFRGYAVHLSWTRKLSGRQQTSQAACLFPERLSLIAADLVARSVPPVASLKVQGGVAELAFGGSLARFDGQRGGRRSLFKVGQAFRIVRRRRGAERGQSLDLSLFLATSVKAGEGRVIGEMKSGGVFKQSDRRFEDFAEALTGDGTAPVRLRLLDRELGQPLRGYQAYELVGKRAEYRGVTDGFGKLTVSLKAGPVSTLELRFNKLILARIPVVAAVETRDHEIVLRMRRREDQSKYHLELDRISRDIDELLLLREVAMEDAAAQIASRQFDAALKVLKAFKADAKKISGLGLRLRHVASDAELAGQDLSLAMGRIAKQLRRAKKLVDMSAIESRIGALRNSAKARGKAEALIFEADEAVADHRIKEAMAKLEKAILADPSWDLPKSKLELLKSRWKVKDPVHRRARDQILSMESWDWTLFKARLPKIRESLKKLKEVNDILTLRVASRSLTRRFGRLNDQARAAMNTKDLVTARAKNQLALEVGAVVDEISAFLRQSGS